MTTAAHRNGSSAGPRRSEDAVEDRGEDRAPRWDPGFDRRDGPPARPAAAPPSHVPPHDAPESRGGQAASRAEAADRPQPPRGGELPPPAAGAVGAAAPGSGGSSGREPSGAGGGSPAAESALSSARLLRPVKRAPRSGWRAAVYVASGGWINPGESDTDRRRRELAERVNQRLTGCYRVAAVSVKGGVGKTSTTVGLGSAFASLRGDRVIALDANPDRGNLAEKVPSETTATVRHLLADAEHITSSADVRAYTSQAPSRLEVLASESDPEVSEAYDDREYQATVDLLSRHYNILLTDCGTGLLHAALRAAVEIADSLLIITSASIDGARAAQATVDWLDAHGHRELVARSVTVITGVRSRPGTVDLDAVERYFAARTREVVRIPFDRHLDEGAEIDLEALAPATRDALLTLAAVVADDFPRTARLGGGARRRTPALLPGHRNAPDTHSAGTPRDGAGRDES